MPAIERYLFNGNTNYVIPKRIKPTMNKELCDAINAKDTWKIRYKLARGVSAKGSLSSGKTLLHALIDIGCLDTIQYCLKKMKDTYSYGYSTKLFAAISPLCYAVKCKARSEIIEEIAKTSHNLKLAFTMALKTDIKIASVIYRAAVMREKSMCLNRHVQTLDSNLRLQFESAKKLFSARPTYNLIFKFLKSTPSLKQKSLLTHNITSIITGYMDAKYLPKFKKGRIIHENDTKLIRCIQSSKANDSSCSVM